MNKSQSVEASKEEAVEVLARLVIDSIQDIKGKQVVKLDLRKLVERPSDFFVICQGESTVQVSAIAENIKIRVKNELGMLPTHFEGQTGSKWLLVDYFDIVVHIFYPETREFYGLEELWSDAESTSFEDV